jgi:glycosyltransferase involved in cell wall biosynthesis
MAGAKYHPLSIDLSATTMAKNYMALYENLIEEQRAVGVKVSTPEPPKIVETTDYCLGIVPDGWQGIARAIEPRTHSICTPEKAIVTAKQCKPCTIIFGGFLARWYPLVRALKQCTGARIIITYHGTALMDEFGHENRDGLIHALASVREGYADCLSFPHEGMARAMNHLHKINAIFEPNTITTITRPDVPKATELHIGLFGTGMPWKNIDTQIIAASITPNLKMLHTQNLTYPELPNQLGIAYKVHPYFHNRKEFYNLAAQMKINLAVTITEAFGYFALESLMLGVPAIVGSTTPSYRLAEGDLKRCIVNYIDDPAAISDAVQDVLEHYDLVLEAGMRMLKKLTP